MNQSRVGLAQLVRFLLVKLIYPGSNHRFDMYVVFTANYSFCERRRLVNSEMLLLIDFMNLKIKSAQSFRGAHRGRVCVRVFIGVSAHMCMSICVCTVFLKKPLHENMVSSSILLYPLVPRNITELYSSVLKLRKIPGTDVHRPVYSLNIRGSNRRIYRGKPTNITVRT
jgi:hypothetical protein